jgi:hypothetical protein|tara:strand:- start:3577 stop:3945 length:369 start_codon:yes stop_codon:yes gene_type:complete
MYIRLELARSKEYPQGSSDFGYEVVAPLTADGHIDPEVWRQHRKACTVRRFWRGEEDERGHLVRTRGGHWVFHYDVEGDPDEDDTGFRFSSHAFRPGEYVSLKEADGEEHTFQVAQLRPRIY